MKSNVADSLEPSIIVVEESIPLITPLPPSSTLHEKLGIPDTFKSSSPSSAADHHHDENYGGKEPIIFEPNPWNVIGDMIWLDLANVYKYFWKIFSYIGSFCGGAKKDSQKDSQKEEGTKKEEDTPKKSSTAAVDNTTVVSLWDQQPPPPPPPPPPQLMLQPVPSSSQIPPPPQAVLPSADIIAPENQVPGVQGLTNITVEEPPVHSPGEIVEFEGYIYQYEAIDPKEFEKQQQSAIMKPINSPSPSAPPSFAPPSPAAPSLAAPSLASPSPGAPNLAPPSLAPPRPVASSLGPAAPSPGPAAEAAKIIGGDDIEAMGGRAGIEAAKFIRNTAGQVSTWMDKLKEVTKTKVPDSEIYTESKIASVYGSEKVHQIKEYLDEHLKEELSGVFGVEQLGGVITDKRFIHLRDLKLEIHEQDNVQSSIDSLISFLEEGWTITINKEEKMFT